MRFPSQASIFSKLYDPCAGSFWVLEDTVGGRMIHIILEKQVMGHESWPSPIEAPPEPTADADVDASVTHRTFFELAMGDKPLGKVVFGLFGNALPKTVENFRALCAGDKVRICYPWKPPLLHVPLRASYYDTCVQQPYTYVYIGKIGSNIWLNLASSTHSRVFQPSRRADTDDDTSVALLDLLVCRAILSLVYRCTIRAVNSTESFPPSWYKGVISHKAMAEVASPSMAASLMMKAFLSSTLRLVSCPWQMLAPTQMGLNFSSLLAHILTLMASTWSLGRLSLAWSLCSR